MIGTLTYSLLELAHATSQNLGFAHRDDVYVSYGEETITETNLLELSRRHPAIIRLSTFSKGKEALNGADWEWHIIGSRRKLCMRIQAKRLQKDNKLKIPHKVKSSSKQQIDLLIADTKKYGLKPVYCIYASEKQRFVWKKRLPSSKFEDFEYGCLLASAHKVKKEMPTSLRKIEAHCFPWHYLIERRRYSEQKLFYQETNDETNINFLGIGRALRASDDDLALLSEFPTIDQLNAVQRPKTDFEGVVEVDSAEFDRDILEGVYRERGISRLIQIDVRDISPQHRLKG